MRRRNTRKDGRTKNNRTLKNGGAFGVGVYRGLLSFSPFSFSMAKHLIKRLAAYAEEIQDSIGNLNMEIEKLNALNDLKPNDQEQRNCLVLGMELLIFKNRRNKDEEIFTEEYKKEIRDFYNKINRLMPTLKKLKSKDTGTPYFDNDSILRTAPSSEAVPLYDNIFKMCEEFKSVQEYIRHFN